MDETVDNANASANQSNQDKTKNQLVIGNGTDKLTNPGYRARDPASDIGKHRRNGICSGSSLKKSHLSKKII